MTVGDALVVIGAACLCFWILEGPSRKQPKDTPEDWGIRTPQAEDPVELITKEKS